MSEPSYRTVMQMFDMLRLLQRRGRRGMPVNEVADALGVNRRTVLRYLDALAASIDNENGEPLVQRETRDGAAWAVMPREQSPLTANIYQYAAVFAATRHFAGRSLLGDTASGLLDRVEESDRLPADVLERVATSFCYVPWGPKSYAANAEVLDPLVRGAIYRRPVRLTYRKAGADEASERVLEPWSLVMYRDGLYLLARQPDAGSNDPPFLYAVDRIEAAEALRDGSFEVPDSFNPDSFFGRTLGLWQTTDPPEPVRLAFSRGAAALVRERRWPGFVSWTEDGDREILELHVPLTPEVTAWATAWGPELEVLAPASLRSAVAQRHAEALRHYQDG